MRHLYCFILLLLVVSCSVSKSRATQAEIEALDDLVNGKRFIIESEWVYPQMTNAMQQISNNGILGPGNNAGSISLIGNPNFLKIAKNSISSYLPYFGERQMNTGYGRGNNGGAIVLKGLIKNYEIEKNNDNSYNISFDANNKNENFRVYLRLFPNLNSTIRINSSSRFSISYQGHVKPELSKE
mgnify:CR=1 FL=1